MSQSLWQVAHLNLARARAVLDDPAMAGFVADVARIRELADRAPGFVWSFGDEYEARSDSGEVDPRLLVTMSVWTSIEALHAFVYRSAHGESFSRRAEWFEPMTEASLVLWWVPAGRRPRPEDGIARLQHLRRHGSTPFAFTFGQPFPPPDDEQGLGPTRAAARPSS